MCGWTLQLSRSFCFRLTAWMANLIRMITLLKKCKNALFSSFQSAQKPFLKVYPAQKNVDYDRDASCWQTWQGSLEKYWLKREKMIVIFLLCFLSPFHQPTFIFTSGIRLVIKCLAEMIQKWNYGHFVSLYQGSCSLL